VLSTTKPEWAIDLLIPLLSDKQFLDGEKRLCDAAALSLCDIYPDLRSIYSFKDRDRRIEKLREQIARKKAP
jgi:hypothetical protein